MQSELLAGFQEAIRKAIEEGTTITEFRRDFDQLVSRHGWSYKGGRGWRTRVIYETNLRTSYMAGRYRQMQEVAETRPYWRYQHSDAVEYPRAEHVAWHGLTLRHDDPWWSTHYPPNGWGCQCYVETLSEQDLRDEGKIGADRTPPVKYEEKVVGSRGPSPRVVDVPEGIDPGWGYNVGEAAWGRKLSDQAMNAWREQADRWERLDDRTAAYFGRPARLQLDAPRRALGPRATSRGELEGMMRDALGGEEMIFRTPSGQRINLNAVSLSAHIDDLSRSVYAPLLPEVIEAPFEEWQSFERHTASGKVELRTRLVKGFDIGRGRSIMVVGNAVRGMFEGWTFVPTGDISYIERQRVGRLAWGRER